MAAAVIIFSYIFLGHVCSILCRHIVETMAWVQRLVLYVHGRMEYMVAAARCCNPRRANLVVQQTYLFSFVIAGSLCLSLSLSLCLSTFLSLP